jgi:hypothetical protein
MSLMKNFWFDTIPFDDLPFNTEAFFIKEDEGSLSSEKIWQEWMKMHSKLIYFKYDVMTGALEPRHDLDKGFDFEAVKDELNQIQVFLSAEGMELYGLCCIEMIKEIPYNILISIVDTKVMCMPIYKEWKKNAEVFHLQRLEQWGKEKLRTEALKKKTIAPTPVKTVQKVKPVLKKSFEEKVEKKPSSDEKHIQFDKSVKTNDGRIGKIKKIKKPVEDEEDNLPLINSVSNKRKAEDSKKNVDEEPPVLDWSDDVEVVESKSGKKPAKRSKIVVSEENKKIIEIQQMVKEIRKPKEVQTKKVEKTLDAKWIGCKVQVEGKTLSAAQQIKITKVNPLTFAVVSQKTGKAVKYPVPEEAKDDASRKKFQIVRDIIAEHLPNQTHAENIVGCQNLVCVLHALSCKKERPKDEKTASQLIKVFDEESKAYPILDLLNG